MSGLNFLNKLLDGVDVEWLSLGELGDFIRGNGLQKKDFVESGFPAIHYGQIYTRYGLSADKTFTYVLPELANKLRKAQKNDLLLATTSENDEDVVKPLAWLGDNVAISGDMMLFRHEQNVKYLAYFFQSEIFQTQKMKYITGAKVRRVSSGDLSKIKIPIPCSNNPEKSLAIQSEIVRILDKFTALTAELTAELNMRKKQYNYYRDQLLSFKDGEVEWKTLGEVAQYSKTRISFELLDERNYVGVDNLLQNRAGKSLSNHVPTSGKLTEFIPNDILIGNIRPYLKKIWQADCIGGTNGDVLVIRCIDSSINT
ncbi:restriction endonuclease subunit S, partial [Escherichia coli]|nr:restriction endonuclease subunit S [Escherichia coli]